MSQIPEIELDVKTVLQASYKTSDQLIAICVGSDGQVTARGQESIYHFDNKLRLLWKRSLQKGYVFIDLVNSMVLSPDGSIISVLFDDWRIRCLSEKGEYLSKIDFNNNLIKLSQRLRLKPKSSKKDSRSNPAADEFAHRWQEQTRFLEDRPRPSRRTRALNKEPLFETGTAKHSE